MTWETPKTNWYGKSDSNGNYTGDYFNVADFNRIKNNLVYLHDLAITMYDNFNITDLGNDRTYSDYFYASEINSMVDNRDTINYHTVKKVYKALPTYVDNGNTMTYSELNLLESSILDLYNWLTNQSEGRRKFTWNFGTKEDF